MAHPPPAFEFHNIRLKAGRELFLGGWATSTSEQRFFKALTPNNWGCAPSRAFREEAVGQPTSPPLGDTATGRRLLQRPRHIFSRITLDNLSYNKSKAQHDRETRGLSTYNSAPAVTYPAEKDCNNHQPMPNQDFTSNYLPLKTLPRARR